MKSILKMISMRIIGIFFSVIGAIIIALVWLNMGTITSAIMGKTNSADASQAQLQNPSTSKTESQANNSIQDISQSVSNIAKTSSRNLAANSNDVNGAAKKIKAIDKKMNSLIDKNQNVPFEEWPKADQKKYASLESQKKMAINEYNSSAIEVNENSSNTRSSIMEALKSFIHID